MSQTGIRLCDADALDDVLANLAESIRSTRDPDKPLRLIGIRTRGVPIALRLADRLAPALGGAIPVGAVDITLYRDDLANVDRWPVLRGTDIPFPVDGAEIVLVDDVLFTGRTVRAALNAVCDLGRPARVRLAVLVDRGHRELPIQPDAVGITVPTRRDERVLVRVGPVDPVEEIVRIEAAAPLA